VATRVIGPLAYIGGKRRIANALVALIPEHITYVEPFAGGAQVFFHKPRSKVEVLNDLDNEIVNFLRVCQRHPEELARVPRWQPASRRLFEWHEQQPPELLTDIERAARFFYLQKNGWGGKRTRRNFHHCVTKPPNYDPEVIERRLTDAAARLRRVQIDQAPYQEILRRYDRPTTFFYCDPPYVGVDLYQHNFTDEQFQELASLLSALKGRFLLSINDCPKAREWFQSFHRLEIAFSYTSTRTPGQFPELLFANYPLPNTLTPRLLVEGAKADSEGDPSHVV
jgi:DNA adenine methylase